MDYIATYVERDVRNIINIQDLGLFQKFLKLCAGRSGSVLNKTSLAADCGISETNCGKWLSILEQSGLIMLLQPYYNNFNKRLVKSPKLYFIDTGLCCNLLGITTVEHLQVHPLIGSIVATYVVSEILKCFCNAGIAPKLYYWRDKTGNEVDLIMELDHGKIVPIEIKTGQTILCKMTTNLQKWCELANVEYGVLLYGGTSMQNRGNIVVLPISAVI